MKTPIITVMKAPILTFFCLCILTLFSCNNESTNNILVLSKYPNSKIHTAINSINDSVYIFLTYFEDGTIKDSLPCKNGRINGIAREYTTDNMYGHVKYYTEYKDAVPYGFVKAYLLTGEKRCFGHANAFKFIGERIFYFKNGSVSAYSFYNMEGKECYFRKYSENGDSLQEVGDLIISLSNSEDTYKPGDTINLTAITATPPDLEINAYYGELNKHEGLFNPRLSKIENNSFMISLIAPETKGEYIGSMQLKVKNKKGNIRKVINYYRIWVR